MRSALLIGLLSLNFAGCQRAARTAAPVEQIHATYDKSGVLTKLEADSDHDGLIDTWAYMEGARVVRVEIDEDGDGSVDRWEYHSGGRDGDTRPVARAVKLGPGGLTSPDKTIERIERATRHDGVVSRWEYFDHGMLTRVEEDRDGDGTIDKWETYKDGSLSMMAIDTRHRGKPDRRLVYRPDGTLDRIEIDPTGSGSFQPLSAQPAK